MGDLNVLDSRLDASLRANTFDNYVQHTSAPFVYEEGDVLSITVRDSDFISYFKLDDVSVMCECLGCPPPAAATPEVSLAACHQAMHSATCM